MTQIDNIDSVLRQQVINMWFALSAYTTNAVASGQTETIYVDTSLLTHVGFYSTKALDVTFTDNMAWITPSGVQISFTKSEVDTLMNALYSNQQSLAQVTANCTTTIDGLTDEQKQTFNVSQYFVDNCPWIV